MISYSRLDGASMIRTLILFFLSEKPTHGYEIQKFIQLNQLDSWTKIQSGSIYYALGKLEKEDLIELVSEQQDHIKGKKIYKITEKGIEELNRNKLEELEKPIYSVGSDKFILYPFLTGIDQQLIINKIEKHIVALKKEIEELQLWQTFKIRDKHLKIEALTFELMLSNLENQVRWHEVLLTDLDNCMAVSQQVSQIIKNHDFSTMNNISEMIENSSLDYIEKLKGDILQGNKNSSSKLEELIQLISKK